MDVGCGALDRDSGSGRLVWKATQQRELKAPECEVWDGADSRTHSGQLSLGLGSCGCGMGRRNFGEKLGLTLPWAFSTRTSLLKPGRSSGRRPVVQDIFKPV